MAIVEWVYWNKSPVFFSEPTKSLCTKPTTTTTRRNWYLPIAARSSCCIRFYCSQMWLLLGLFMTFVWILNSPSSWCFRWIKLCWTRTKWSHTHKKMPNPEKKRWKSEASGELFSTAHSQHQQQRRRDVVSNASSAVDVVRAALA